MAQLSHDAVSEIIQRFSVYLLCHETWRPVVRHVQIVKVCIMHVQSVKGLYNSYKSFIKAETKTID